jgi:acetylornithine deacetylase
VIPPNAEAEVMFRTVGPTADLQPVLDALRPYVEPTTVLEVPAVTMKTVPGFDAAVFPFSTDIPFLDRWGTPLLFGPGSILVAHTDHEYVEIADLERAVDSYVTLARTLVDQS